MDGHMHPRNDGDVTDNGAFHTSKFNSHTHNAKGSHLFPLTTTKMVTGRQRPWVRHTLCDTIDKEQL